MKVKPSEFISSHPVLRNCITWLFRIVTGSLFIYSGFVKGIDPWGSFYKFEEYIALFGIEPPSALIIAGVFFLCIYEFFCGISLLTGSFRRSVPLLSGLFMLAMLPLTFWIMLSNPVSDCGCFGDAFVISNQATFAKNVVLTLMIVWLIPYNRYASSLITPYLQWIQATASALFIIAIGGIGYLYQPLIDFRPYVVGSPIISSDHTETTPDESEYKFIYRNGTEEREFSEDDELPDEESGWVFVDRKEVKKSARVSHAKTDRNLALWSQEDDEDVTFDVLSEKGNMIILFMPSLKDVSIASTWIINSLKDWAAKLNIEFIAVVAGSASDIEEWKDLSLADYPIYTADDTQIKEVVRGNPGVVFLSDGIVKWKSTLRALPANDFMSDDTPKDPESFRRDDRGILQSILFIYLSVLALLITISFSGTFFYRLLNPIQYIRRRNDNRKHKEE